MSLSGSLTINLYSIAILVIIFVHTLKSPERSLLQQKYFSLILVTTVLMLVTDVFSRFDGRPGTLYAAANQAGNFLMFLLSPVLPSLWLLYVHSQVNNPGSKVKRWIVLPASLAAVNAVMLVLSQFFGWFYTIGADNIYHRGPLYWFPVAVTAVITAAAFFLILVSRKTIERKYFITLLLFPVPPVAGIVLQVAYYGLPLILNGAALSILIAFITIQNERMNTDYLTGAYNRKGLELYIRQKISASSAARTFSAILLDLDNFKSINDSFGHNTGDDVLVSSVRLLRGCIRSDDLIARYGGDEFYIILNISGLEDLEAVVRRIEDCIDNYNASSGAPFKLGVSMGYAVYDYGARLTAAEFRGQLDALMYANKRAGKGSGNVQHQHPGDLID
jgi:diguanylate cyclase (GGDEF)-like protein